MFDKQKGRKDRQKVRAKENKRRPSEWEHSGRAGKAARAILEE